MQLFTERFLKARVKRYMRLLSRTLPAEDSKVIRHVIRDDELFEEFFWGCCAMAALETAEDIPTMNDGENPLLDWMTWLITYIVDNQDKIIAFIKTLFSL